MLQFTVVVLDNSVQDGNLSKLKKLAEILDSLGISLFCCFLLFYQYIEDEVRLDRDF